ncbi:MAG TPA: chemotaxis protein CheW [Bryobacteraceae bacterium]|nr:chemotaxis protein CheW [Bryobacteraceae bacterium]
MEDLDLIKEFLIESNENLGRMDQEMVELERRPKDATLLASIFRSIHTLKGTCGFLGFSTIERITHQAETILGQVRNGDRDLTPPLVSLVLESVDAVKAELTAIEKTNQESGELYADLVDRLTRSARPQAEEPGNAAVESVLAATVLDVDPPLAAKAAAEADGSASGKGPSVADSTIRVDVGLLDKLMNLVGELVLARNQVLQFTSRLEDVSLNATSQRLNQITSELQEGVMKTRMQPIGVIWNKLPRVVRDLASMCGKQVTLEMDGAETELDKTIIEAIKDPLTHIVRNACDHGIELPEARVRAGKPPQGRLLLRAFHEGGNVNIEIIDDGGGIDAQRVKAKAVQQGLVREEQADRMAERELVNLVFLPGFSTAREVTSISGRGVGMDVVKTNIEKIGGTVDLVSRRGTGSTIRIKIPLTLAIIPGLVVSVRQERFVIPQTSLLELVRLEGAESLRQIEWVGNTPLYRRRGNLLPLAFLDRVLRLDGGGGDMPDVINIVVLQAEDRQFGLVVDRVNDTQEIVVKPLGKQMKGLDCYAGATIMGDGRVALILDVMGIAHHSGVLAEGRTAARGEDKAAAEASSEERKSMLLFRAGEFDRLAVPLALVARLEEIPRERLEHAAGRPVVQYRGQLLPLVGLAGELGVAASQNSDRPLQVIVFADGDNRLGMVVDEIVDIVEDEIRIRRPSSRPGVLGSAVIASQVTDVLDLQAVIQSADTGWFGETQDHKMLHILIAEDSPFGRGLLRSSLEMSGYRVAEASDAADAIAKLALRPYDLVLASLDLAGSGAARILEAVRGNPELTGTQVFAMQPSQQRGSEARAIPAGFAAALSRFDREGMLRSINQLASALAASERAQMEPAARR